MSLDSINFKNEILNLYSKKNYKAIVDKKYIFDNFSNYNDIKILKIYFIACLNTNNIEYITNYENYILANVKDRETIFILIFSYIKIGNFNKALKISHFYLDKNLENASSDLSILNYFNLKKIKIFISNDKNEIQSFFLFSIFLRKILFFDYSIYLLKKLINIDRNNHIYLFHLGKAYQDQEKFRYAIKYLKFSLKNKSDLEDTINSLAVCLIEIGKYDEAEKILKDGIKKNKNNKFFYSNLGKIYNETEQFNKSIKFYNLGLDIDMNDPIINFGKAICLLKKGNINESFKYLNYRINGYLLTNEFKSRFKSSRLTNLENIKNKKILVFYEQGLGDTIQFCRYIKVLLEGGAKVFFIPQKNLSLLMKSLDRKVKIFEEKDEIPNYDYYVPLFDLPFLFHNKFGNFNYKKSYLNIENKYIEIWKKKLPKNKINIAICWKSNNDLSKSFSFTNFKKISKIKKINLISLQFKSELEFSNSKSDIRIQYFNNLDKNNDFLDSACIIKLVDLVITCDTSICHLSGALNTKTWVLLRKNPDWRWYNLNNVWYNNLKIFKQKEFFNWKSVFDDVYNNLINEYKL